MWWVWTLPNMEGLTGHWWIQREVSGMRAPPGPICVIFRHFSGKIYQLSGWHPAFGVSANRLGNHGSATAVMPISIRQLLMRQLLLPPAYVVRREGNVLTRVCPSICLSTGGGYPYPIMLCNCWTLPRMPWGSWGGTLPGPAGEGGTLPGGYPVGGTLLGEGTLPGGGYPVRTT